MDVALFGKVKVQGTTTTASSSLEVFHDVLEQGQRSEDTNFLPVKLFGKEKRTSGSTVKVKYFSLGSIPYS